MNNKDDERLIKNTIAFLKDYAEQGYENAVECIDWLEKQCEQKPTVVPKFKVGATIKNKKTNEIVTISDYSQLYGYYHDINHSHEIKFSEQDDWELVEQKPVNWLAELEGILKNATPEQLHEFQEKYFKEELVDWGGEDKKIFYLIVARLHSHPSVDSEEYDKLYNWLKSHLSFTNVTTAN